MPTRSPFTFLLTAALILPVAFSAKGAENTLNVLFVGNSYTARHNLAKVVKSMAEAGHPELTFDITQIIYGGRTLSDHWRLGTQHIVNQHATTQEDIEGTIESLKEAVKNPKDRYAKSGLKRMQALAKDFHTKRKKWDIIVLQSYRDDLKGAESRYMQYAPRYAQLAKKQGARVVLYVTTPTTQNAKPLETVPAEEPILKKTRSTARLANAIDASVAPMALVAHRCQAQRPDFTLRFVNDAHLNKTLAYLTACTIYAAIFERSPQGLPIDSITDIRFFGNDQTKDRDGKPITKQFNDKDRNDLQRIAWEGWQEFQKLRNR